MHNPLNIQFTADNTDYLFAILGLKGSANDNPDDIIYQNRADIEKLICAFYHAWDPENMEHEVLRDQLLCLTSWLIDYTANGAYTQKQLEKILAEFELHDNQLPLCNESIIGLQKRKMLQQLLDRFLYPARRILSRATHATADAMAAAGPSVHNIHEKLDVLDRPLMYMAWIFPLLKLNLSLFLIARYTIGCGLTSEKESQLSRKSRLKDQLNRGAPQFLQLIQLIIWSSVRFIAEENYPTYVVSFTLGLFSFALVNSLLMRLHQMQSINRLLEKFSPFSIQHAALSETKQALQSQHKVQIAIWASYVVGGTISAVADNMETDQNKIILVAGASWIVLTCLFQVVWDLKKPNLIKLQRNNKDVKIDRDVKTDSENTPLACASFFHSENFYRDAMQGGGAVLAEHRVIAELMCNSSKV